MKISTVILAALYASGVMLAFKFSASFALILMFSSVIVITIRALLKKSPAEFLRLLYIFAFCLGIILTIRYASPERKDLNQYTDMYVTFTGRICELPSGKDRENRQYFVNVKQLECDGETHGINERLLVTSKEHYDYGDTICAEGFIENLSESMNTSSSDIRLYYESKDIFFKCYAVKSELADEKIRDYSVHSIALYIKNGIIDVIDRYTADADSAAVLKAILTGDKSYISDDLDKTFEISGTKRFLYPAYLHIFMILFLISLFAAIVKKKYRDAAIVIILLLYAICESSQPIFIKSCVLMILIVIFRKKFGFLYFLDALGAAIFCICIANPLLLYDAGFVISIFASVLISVFYKPSEKYFKAIKNRYIRKTIVIGSICTLGLWPLFAYYFNGVTIYTVAAAVLFIPMTAIITVLSPVLFAMLCIFGAAPVIAQIVSFLLWLYVKISVIISFLPFATVVIPRVSITFMFSYAAFIYAIWFKLRNDKSKSLSAASVSAALAIVCLLSLVPKINTMEITFVNVGQGDGAFIKMPLKNEVILIDGGGGSEYNKDYNPGETVYVPYLKSAGVTEVSCAIVSHCHKDHVQGIIAAAENLKVDQIFLPAATDKDNEFLKELYDVSEKYGCKLNFVSEDTRLTFRSGLTLDILVAGGTTKLSDDENDQSLLVKASYGETDCLFTGDMTALGEYNFLKSGRVTECEILKVAHHGSKGSNSEEFIDTVNPLYSVISVGKDNGYGLPAKVTVERLSGSKILRTDENGDIKISADKNGIKSVSTYR